MTNKKTQEKSWNNYYLNHSFRYSNIILHIPYLVKILLLNPIKVLEIGCGPADHSVFLKKIKRNTEISLVDLDGGIVNKLKKENQGKFKKVYLGDILDSTELNKLKIPRVDAVISQGLLEHFNDKDFIKVIENFRGRAKHFIFSVPSDNYPVKEFGNEILRSKKEIKNLLINIDDIRFNVNYYLDTGIRTKIFGAKVSKKSAKDKLKYLLFGSNHILAKVTYLGK